jgi:membrane protein implicated in regulation of membrane protease activity
LLLAGTIFNAYISQKFSFLNFLSLGFPFLMISNVFLIVFWIFSFKKRAVVFIIITIFFLTPIRRWINYSKTKTKGKIINVITFNNKNSFGKIKESFLDSKNADVIMLQELAM